MKTYWVVDAEMIHSSVYDPADNEIELVAVKDLKELFNSPEFLSRVEQAIYEHRHKPGSDFDRTKGIHPPGCYNTMAEAVISAMRKEVFNASS